MHWLLYAYPQFCARHCRLECLSVCSCIACERISAIARLGAAVLQAVAVYLYASLCGVCCILKYLQHLAHTNLVFVSLATH